MGRQANVHNQMRVLRLMVDGSRSLLDITRACGWCRADGTPSPRKVYGILRPLQRDKLVEKVGGSWTWSITPLGRSKLEEHSLKAMGGASSSAAAHSTRQATTTERRMPWGPVRHQPRQKTPSELSRERRKQLADRFGVGDIKELVALAEASRVKPKICPTGPHPDESEAFSPSLPDGPCQHHVRVHGQHRQRKVTVPLPEHSLSVLSHAPPASNANEQSSAPRQRTPVAKGGRPRKNATGFNEKRAVVLKTLAKAELANRRFGGLRLRDVELECSRLQRGKGTAAYKVHYVLCRLLEHGLVKRDGRRWSITPAGRSVLAGKKKDAHSR